MEEKAGSAGQDPARPDPGGSGGEVVLERGPGVHVVSDAQPARAARDLASTIGAELADSPAAVKLAVRARLARVSGLAGPIDEIDLREQSDVIDVQDPAGALVGAGAPPAALHAAPRRGSSTAQAPTRTLAVAHVARLRQLASALERAARIHQRTEQAATDRLRATVPGDTRAEPTGSTAAEPSGEPIDPPTAEPADAPAPQPGAELQQIRHDPDASGTRRATHPRNSAPIAGGVLLLGVALAGAILLTGAPAVLAVAPILLGLFLAGLLRRTTSPIMGWRNTGRPFDTMPPHPLPAVSIDAPTAREAGAALTTPAPQGDRTQPTPVEPAKRAAEGQSPGAPARPSSEPAGAVEALAVKPASPEPVRAAALESAAVRAAAVALDRAREAWQAAWAELGENTPPDATSGPALDTALVRLQQRIEDGAVVLGGLQGVADDGSKRRRLNELLAGRPLEAVIEREPGPTSATLAPLVLVEPFAGLGREERAALQRQLEALADRYEVIVIVRDRPQATEG